MDGKVNETETICLSSFCCYCPRLFSWDRWNFLVWKGLKLKKALILN